MSVASEPPKKKRKSKWGVKPEDLEVPKNVPSSPTVGGEQAGGIQGPKGAEAAAAKLNAMLAAQGKLVKSDPPPYKPVLPSQTSATPLFSSLGSTVSGAGLLSTPAIPLLPVLTRPTPPASSGPYYVQDKVFVGLAKVPSSFNLKERLEGPESSFLSHISKQIGAKVFLRGRGSGYIEPTSKTESFESLHIYISHPNKQGLESARQLCESLIETVKKDYDGFVAAQRLNAPLGFGGSASHALPPRVPYVNPYHYPPVPPPRVYGPLPPVPPGYPLPPPPQAPYPGQPLPPVVAPPAAMGAGYGGYPLPPHQPGFPLPPPSLPGTLPLPPQGYYGALPPSQYLPPQPAPQPPAPKPDALPDVFSAFKPLDKAPERRKFTEVIESTSTDESADDVGHLEPSPHLSLNNTGTDADDGSSDNDKQQRLMTNGEDPVKHTEHHVDDNRKMTDSSSSRSSEFEFKKPTTPPQKETTLSSPSSEFDFKVPMAPPARPASSLSSSKRISLSSSSSSSSSLISSRTGDKTANGGRMSMDKSSDGDKETVPTSTGMSGDMTSKPSLREATREISWSAIHSDSKKVEELVPESRTVSLPSLSLSSSSLVVSESLKSSLVAASSGVAIKSGPSLASQSKESALSLVSYSSEDSDDSDSNT